MREVVESKTCGGNQLKLQGLPSLRWGRFLKLLGQKGLQYFLDSWSNTDQKAHAIPQHTAEESL